MTEQDIVERRRASRSRALAAARWIAGVIAVLLAVSLAVFVATRVIPGDAAQLRLGPRATPAAVETLRRELGTDRSALAQYVAYLRDLMRGDLGQTINGDPVSGIVARRAPATIEIILGGTVVCLLISVPVALLAATRRDRPTDHGIRIGALLILFLPSFWVAFVLIRFVALPTGWFPVSGLGSSAGDRLRSLVLPSLTIGFSTAPLLVRSLRSSLVEVLESEYVAVARSLHVSRWRLASRHVLRNAVGPAITLLAVQLGYLLFGAVVIETAFDIPGLGAALVDGARTRDVLLVQGIALVFATVVVMINAFGDLAARLLDPRVRAR